MNKIHIDDKRACHQCKHRNPIAGGRYKVINNGLNHRWYCEICAALDKDLVMEKHIEDLARHFRY